MKPWVAGLGAGAILLLAGAGFLLLDTTTSSMVTVASELSRGCGANGAWPDPLAEPIDEVSYTRAARDGERVGITIPAGPHVMRVETDHVELAPLPSWAQMPQPARSGHCLSEPYLERYAAIGTGTFTVTYLLYG